MFWWWIESFLITIYNWQCLTWTALWLGCVRCAALVCRMGGSLGPEAPSASFLDLSPLPPHSHHHSQAAAPHPGAGGDGWRTCGQAPHLGWCVHQGGRGWAGPPLLCPGGPGGPSANIRLKARQISVWTQPLNRLGKTSDSCMKVLKIICIGKVRDTTLLC